ncbi:GntR family transcriptional regulator [Flavobacterium aquatile]|uniref:Transcriptional regulator n=1 Tax=Flavobacterium aquatile LMG 4008 = ATCC 11947 TaxID=1453498 RepID=A0A095SWW1_9FLAO|nr:GntR family transcriptional regulator [Flavobacterium aquatile]KGD69052.1 transcriptional regulator [Flavobacterium aquatile LMG 4008 = ATCC 11947]OXA65766.1 transcriptional regulator [Flavobacterium aquatile LMG 4008 = ATCC 11947]GEC78090.1 transcriptional regulator [Flavobacterium aquatile]
MKIISINSNSSLPKYKQIVLSIEVAIAENRLKRGDKLPSVNKVSLEFSISRDTVLLAYDELKKRGIIYAILGKGYYVKSVEFSFEQRIFLLFDELNSFKEDLYNSFLESINNSAQIDIFFHHFNIEMFKKLINESNGNYSKYIIMPTNLMDAAKIIKILPKQDVYILDQTNNDLKDYPSVHQNFIKDIYDGLSKGKNLIDKYEKLILIFPGFREPIGMKIGFEKFCLDHHFKHEIITEFKNRTIKKGEVYIIPDDRDLVNVIEQSKFQELILGSDYGIISYNETPLKKIVENGITTISTDFKEMGQLLATMILKGRKDQIENRNTLIIRKSI